MKIRLLPVGIKIKRKINADAIPTKLKHKEKNNSACAVPVTLAKKRRHEEVRKKCIHVMKLSYEIKILSQVKNNLYFKQSFHLLCRVKLCCNSNINMH